MRGDVIGGKENAISSRYKALQLDSRVNIVSISLSFETSERASDWRRRKEGLGGMSAPRYAFEVCEAAPSGCVLELSKKKLSNVSRDQRKAEA